LHDDGKLRDGDDSDGGGDRGDRSEHSREDAGAEYQNNRRSPHPIFVDESGDPDDSDVSTNPNGAQHAGDRRWKGSNGGRSKSLYVGRGGSGREPVILLGLPRRKNQTTDRRWEIEMLDREINAWMSKMSIYSEPE